MLVFNESVEARNTELDDVRGRRAPARDAPSVRLLIPVVRGLCLRTRQAHLAYIPRSTHGSYIRAQLPKSLRELVDGHPLDRRPARRLNLFQPLRRKKLSSAGHIGPDVRQQLEWICRGDTILLPPTLQHIRILG